MELNTTLIAPGTQEKLAVTEGIIRAAFRSFREYTGVNPDDVMSST